LNSRVSDGTGTRYSPAVLPDFEQQNIPAFERARQLGVVVVDPAPLVFDFAGPFVFTHIPKTGGLTLRAIIHAICLSQGRKFLEVFGSPYVGLNSAIGNWAGVSENERRDAHVISGHLPSNIHPGHHIVVLRDPIQQAVSAYGHGVWRGSITERISAAEFFESGVLLDNLQTRLLSGRIDLLEANARCTDEALGLALRNLTGYALAADLDGFNDFLAVLLAILKAPRVIYFRRNVTPVDLPPELISEIRDVTMSRAFYDVALFESIRGRVRGGRPPLSAAAEKTPGCLAFNDPNAEHVVHYDDDGEGHLKALAAAGVPVHRHMWTMTSDKIVAK
jgi:hypothetical protein